MKRTPLKRHTPLKRKTPMKRGPLKRRITRQRRARMDRDAEYLALEDIYLEENPSCVNCPDYAKQVHHICRGPAGRAASLLNQDTWLGVCGDVCHAEVDALPLEDQIRMKQFQVLETINRLLTIPVRR